MVVTVVWLFFIGMADAAELRVVGSDLLGLNFFKTLYAVAGEEKLRLVLALDGSRPGLEELKAGRADLALLTLPSGHEPDARIFESVPLAWHLVVVLVPATAPLARVNYAQLTAVFGADSPISYVRWGELGVGGEWTGRPLVPLVPAGGLGFTSEFFRHTVLKGGAIKAQIARFQSPADFARCVAGDVHTMALASALPANSTELKVLPIAMHPGGPAFAPTRENVHAGSYPLRLSLQMVFRRDATARLRPLLRCLLDDEVARIFEQAGLVPIPEPERLQQRQVLENGRK